MATKIQQIIEKQPRDGVMFGSWLSSNGIDARGQYSYMRSGWLDRISKGVYHIHGATPTLMSAISSYNSQLGKKCTIGAYTALELRGYSHYSSLGKPVAYFFNNKNDRLPAWLLEKEWDMNIKYMTTTFLGDNMLGVESMTINHHDLLVSSPERAILECLHLPGSSSSLLDIYYVVEGLTTLRPKLMSTLLRACTSQKVKRLFIYMAEKAQHPWWKALEVKDLTLGKSRLMVTPTGKYINKYNMTIPKDLAEYD